MMRLREKLMSFLGRHPLIDEEVQKKREARTEAARKHAIETRVLAEGTEANILATTDRLAQMRLSFERANRRLAK